MGLSAIALKLQTVETGNSAAPFILHVCHERHYDIAPSEDGKRHISMIRLFGECSTSIFNFVHLHRCVLIIKVNVIKTFHHVLSYVLFLSDWVYCTL